MAISRVSAAWKTKTTIESTTKVRTSPTNFISPQSRDYYFFCLPDKTSWEWGSTICPCCSSAIVFYGDEGDESSNDAKDDVYWQEMNNLINDLCCSQPTTTSHSPQKIVVISCDPCVSVSWILNSDQNYPWSLAWGKIRIQLQHNNVQYVSYVLQYDCWWLWPPCNFLLCLSWFYNNDFHKGLFWSGVYGTCGWVSRRDQSSPFYDPAPCILAPFQPLLKHFPTHQLIPGNEVPEIPTLLYHLLYRRQNASSTLSVWSPRKKIDPEILFSLKIIECFLLNPIEKSTLNFKPQHIIFIYRLTSHNIFSSID